MRCPNCNQKIDPKMKFCSNCGMNLEKFPENELDKKEEKEEKKKTMVKRTEYKGKRKKKKKWIWFLPLLFLIILIALFAANQKEKNAYEKAIDNGIESINDGEYSQASDYFEEASEIKEGDETAKTARIASKDLQAAQDLYDENELKEALTEIEEAKQEIQSFKSEKLLDAFDKQIQQLSKEMNHLLGKYDDLSKDLDAIYSKIKKENFSEKEVNEASEIVFDILSAEEMDHPYFTNLKKEAQSLQSTLDNYKDDFKEERAREKEIKEKLEHYSGEEIEYARLALMLDEPEGSTIYVNKEEAKYPVFNHDGADSSIVFPNRTIWLTGEYMPDGFVVYSPLGEGYIDLYPMPYKLDPNRTSEEYKEYAKEILDNAERLYIDPADDEELIEKLENTDFIIN